MKSISLGTCFGLYIDLLPSLDLFSEPAYVAGIKRRWNLRNWDFAR